MNEDPPGEKIVEFYYELDRDAEGGGYHLNPDRETALMLIEGLIANVERFGYRLCPCRLGIGEQKSDLDIICPCDYRDRDLDEYGTCYCGLYVSSRVVAGEAEAESIPDRRPPEKVLGHEEAPEVKEEPAGGDSEIKVWRCTVCGYLCARESPPEICPVCKAGRERFTLFDL